MVNRYPYTDFHELNLDWFLGEFKKVMEKVDTLEETVQQFTDFVTNYFDNLDVQQEINNKLDQMAADGTLSALIQPLFDEYKTEIDGIVATQNSTITNINSRTNVLEARMDEFASLPPGATSGNAELLDIRVMETGETAASAGDAVRGQVAYQYTFNKTSNQNLDEPDEFTPNYTTRTTCYINTSGVIVPGSSYNTFGPIALLPNQILYYKGSGSNTTIAMWCEPDTTYISTAHVNTTSEYISLINDSSDVKYIMLCSNAAEDIKISNVIRKYADNFDAANPKYDLFSKFLRTTNVTTELSFDTSDKYATANFVQTTPILLKAGQNIHFRALISASIYALIKCDKNGGNETGLFAGTGAMTSYDYTAPEDMYVKIQPRIVDGVEIYISNPWNDYYNVDDIRHAVATFSFDDMTSDDYKIHDAFIAKGFKCGFALIATATIDEADNVQYLKWQQEGFSMLSHSTDGSTMHNGDMSTSDAVDRFEQSKKRLNDIGYEITGWVTPSSELGSDFQADCRSRYDFAYTSYYGWYPSVYNLGRPPYNTFSEDSAELYRVDIVNSTLADLESAVDLAIANKGLISLYGHAYDFDSTQLSKLNDLLDYIQGKIDSYEMMLLAPNDAYKYFYNVRKEDI